MLKAHAKVSYIHLFLQQNDIKYMCTWFILFLRNNLSYIHLLLATQGVYINILYVFVIIKCVTFVQHLNIVFQK